MGLFKSTIQTLSDMAIQESGTQIPQTAPAAIVDEFLAELEMMPSLNEQEMQFPAYAVPIRESSRLKKYLIETEDLARYMASNKVDDLLEALDDIANANGISLSTDNLAIVVDESAILQEAEDLGFNVGGDNSNEGNIGTVGLLGPHTDLAKFRRFANSREIVDTVANKYGIPIVKKNYKIGLVDPKHGDIVHNGNKAALSEAAEEAELKPSKDDEILNEPECDGDNDEDGIGCDDSCSKGKCKSKKKKSVSESDEVSELQYLRDIADGKYDDEL